GDDLHAAEQWLTEAGADKERQPTALQTEYIIASRKAAARRQRITLGAVSFGAVVAIVLALLAWQQWTKAVKTLSRSYFQEACGIGVYGYAQVWEGPTGRPLTAQLHSGVRFTRGDFSPSGQSLVTWNTNYFTAESIVSVWRTTDGANIGDVPVGQSARFIGDDAHLAVSNSEAFG